MKRILRCRGAVAGRAAVRVRQAARRRPNTRRWKVTPTHGGCQDRDVDRRDPRCELLPGPCAMGAKHTELRRQVRGERRADDAAPPRTGQGHPAHAFRTTTRSLYQSKTLAGTMAVIRARCRSADGVRGIEVTGVTAATAKRRASRQTQRVRGAVTRALFLCRPCARPAVAGSYCPLPCSASGSPRAAAVRGRARPRLADHVGCFIPVRDPPAPRHAHVGRTDKTVPTFAGDLMM